MIIKKTALTGLVCIFLGMFNFCYSQSNDEIRWLNIEQAEILMKKTPKKLLIDVYTDWCGWCKTMDKKTYANPNVVSIINKNYYAVKLNAENKDAITFMGTTYNYRPEYRCNEIAVALLGGQLSYPHTVFLDEKLQSLTKVPGFVNPDEFIPILNYFGDNFYQRMNWDEYKSSVKKL
ncbi:thioredoxin family protein [Solitalea canadensis]|uniref:Spermatogenesis-associated protein 20-like TRX domain-containing protein n=1 Tax=Solitalea canadensis (strain ATCC 29591 / DSM 3403 / JCM 21819 / LMG 8368 / NBRC 15130 / NCIMB 12057 / USAM 9D) TaxID=929556 RepID=H8KQP1_SOLCM|nr:DUF255 domain-containing protein [Solitalea canadensis]AFD06779.1 Protein of unknown function, DUF255 [Solitalea canadensis DSM 3403]